MKFLALCRRRNAPLPALLHGFQAEKLAQQASGDAQRLQRCRVRSDFLVGLLFPSGTSLGFVLRQGVKDRKGGALYLVLRDGGAQIFRFLRVQKFAFSPTLKLLISASCTSVHTVSTPNTSARAWLTTFTGFMVSNSSSFRDEYTGCVGHFSVTLSCLFGHPSVQVMVLTFLQVLTKKMHF